MDAQEKERLIRELAQHPQETLGEAMRILGSLPKSRWKVAAQVIRAIGYPDNAAALPLLIGHLSDPNWPGWDEVVKTLEEMGPQVVVPHLLLDFWQRDRIQYWGDHLEGICFSLACTIHSHFRPPVAQGRQKKDALRSTTLKRTPSSLTSKKTETLRKIASFQECFR
jgi:hypothetical protein